MAPADKVDPIRDHVFLDAVFGPPTAIAILVQGKNVEPAWILFVVVTSRFGRTGKGQVFSPPHAIEAFVPHASQSVQGHLGISLTQQNRINSNILGVFLLAEIIHEIRNIQQIEGGKQFGVATIAAWIVVVSVNRKNGQIDGIIGVFVVDVAPGERTFMVFTVFFSRCRSRDNLHLDGSRAHTVPTKYIHRFDQGSTSRTIFVE
mmetsp:Transcript_3043/g.6559  ORF Transcript_3043/g.6559 Transcript_3043/m.6559 type:complete len:204 (-) Transcript_3043:258-869(-)